MFDRIVAEVRKRKAVRECEDEQKTQIKLWHLLANFEFVGGQDAPRLQREIDSHLLAIVDHHEKIPQFRDAMAIGCGSDDAPRADVDDAKLEQAISDLNNAMSVAESKDPTVRLLAWQRKWIKDGDYTRPDGGIFETQCSEFIYRWTFGARDAVLTVTERDDIDDEDRDLLHMFVMELETEWSIGPQFIYDEDRSAGNDACEKLQELIIDDAIRRESQEERIADMKGPNRILAQSIAYDNLVKSGKTFTSDEIVGDVFSFRASAEFDEDGTVSANLVVNGR